MRAILARLPIRPRYVRSRAASDAHGVEIVLVPAGHDHGVGRRRQVCCVQPVGDRLDDHFVGIGKALAVGELLAVVDDVDAEPGGRGRAWPGASRRGPRR